MTWIGGTLPVSDEMYFYYGGYARGTRSPRRRTRSAWRE